MAATSAEEMLPVRRDEVTAFMAAWAELDPGASGALAAARSCARAPPRTATGRSSSPAASPLCLSHPSPS